MIREILFRGKPIYEETIIGNDFYYGDLCHYANGEVTIRQPETGYEMAVVPETIGQFTGITDRNGKKIFEGDFDNDGNCVVWCDNCNGLEFAQLDVPTKDICIPCHRCDGNFFFGNHISDFEIVGNVAD